MKINKYLKEIGYKDWDDEMLSDPRSEPDDDGFIEIDFFNLDHTISVYLFSQLSYFRDNCIDCIPGQILKEMYNYSPFGCEELTNKQVKKAMIKWKQIINDMIEGFKLSFMINRWDKTEEEIEKINKGLELFVKYHNCLWW